MTSTVATAVRRFRRLSRASEGSQPVFCTKCGAEIPPVGALFCPKCGAGLPASSKPRDPQTTQAPREHADTEQVSTTADVRAKEGDWTDTRLRHNPVDAELHPYYQRRFAEFDAGGPKWGFNVTAWLLGPLWCPKCVGPPFFWMYVGLFAMPLVLGVLGLLSGDSGQFLATSFAASAIMGPLLVGLVADQSYYDIWRRQRSAPTGSPGRPLVPKVEELRVAGELEAGNATKSGFLADFRRGWQIVVGAVSGQDTGRALLPVRARAVQVTLSEIAGRLGAPRQMLSLSVQESTALNATATVDGVVISMALLRGLKVAELAFVIGHAVGHFILGHCNHPFWRSAPCDDSRPGLEKCRRWRRLAEQSADRVGLRACADLESAVSALLKMACGPDAVSDPLAQEVMAGTRQVPETCLHDPVAWACGETDISERIALLCSTADAVIRPPEPGA